MKTHFFVVRLTVAVLSTTSVYLLTPEIAHAAVAFGDESIAKRMMQFLPFAHSRGIWRIETS